MANYKRKRPKSSSRACSCGGKFFKRDGNAETFGDIKNIPVNDQVKSPNSKKNTRKWCGGKEGKEHNKHWQPAFHLTKAFEEVCSICGKKFRLCFAPWKELKLSSECICGQHKET